MAKTLNALIYPHTPSVIAERRMIDVATIPANKASWWRPIEVAGDDAFDPLTHKRTGPVTTIEETRVLDTYSIVALTAQEISDHKDVAVASLNGGYGPLIRALLSLHNRVRVLEGLPTHTMTQFKTGLKALL
jgi:hypothetical protein